MSVRPAVILASLFALAACAPEPGSVEWCEAKKEQPKSEWTMDDAATFARHCLLEGSTVGSEAWCEDLKETPKSKWSAEDAASYAKHCVM